MRSQSITGDTSIITDRLSTLLSGTAHGDRSLIFAAYFNDSWGQVFNIRRLRTAPHPVDLPPNSPASFPFRGVLLHSAQSPRGQVCPSGPSGTGLRCSPRPVVSGTGLRCPLSRGQVFDVRRGPSGTGLRCSRGQVFDVRRGPSGTRGDSLRCSPGAGTRTAISPFPVQRREGSGPSPVGSLRRAPEAQRAPNRSCPPSTSPPVI
jgi:hypothetical protein